MYSVHCAFELGRIGDLCLRAETDSDGRLPQCVRADVPENPGAVGDPPEDPGDVSAVSRRFISCIPIGRPGTNTPCLNQGER